MPRITLINIRADYSADVVHRLPSTTSYLRLLWMAKEGDVVVVPGPVSPEFFGYVQETLGLPVRSVQIFSWNGILADDVLVSEEFVIELRKRLGTRTDWEIMPCRFTEGTAALAELLDCPPRAGDDFDLQRGSDLLNRKSHFRQLAAGLGLPLPAGSVVRTPAALARTIERLLPVTGTVILKADNAGGGTGNIVLTTGAHGPLPGARETRQVRAAGPEMAARLWAELTDPANPVIVAEAYHLSSRMFYFEYLVEETGRPRFVDSGSIRLEASDDPDAPTLSWIGLEIPADLPSYSLAEAAGWAAAYARQAASLGYRGYLNIDAVLTDDGQVLFNECNGRWGGGLVLHEVAERLLGPRYADTFVVNNLRDIAPVPLRLLYDLLGREDLLADRTSRTGVVVLASDPEGREATECLIIGRDRQENRAIENTVRLLSTRLAEVTAA
jgi:hypothetical protein